MQKTMILILIAGIFIGCSSSQRMRGNKAEAVGEDLLKHMTVSAELVREFSEDEYRFIDLYFKNSSSTWSRLVNIQTDSVQPDVEFHVILPQDFKSWKNSKLLDFDLREEEAKSPKDRVRFIRNKKALKKYNHFGHVHNPFNVPTSLQTHKWVLLQVPKN